MGGGALSRRGLACAAAFAGTVLLAPAAAAAEKAPTPDRAFSLRIERGKLADPERDLQVVKGDAVQVTIASDRDGEVHLHGYRLAAQVGPGKTAHWRFVAHATGRYRLEWHGAGKPDTHDHGPPLATLQVLPR